MAVQFIPGQKGLGTTIGEGLGKGFSSGVNAVLEAKIKQMQDRQLQEQMIPGLKYLLPNASQEELTGISKLPSNVLGNYLKGAGANQLRNQAVEKSSSLLNTLRQIESEGGIDKTLGFFGGSNADVYDNYAKEFGKTIKAIDPNYTPPSSKMNEKARLEAEERGKAILERYLGTPGTQSFSPLTEAEPNKRFSESRGESQQEGPLGSLLRNLTTTAATGVAPLTHLAGQAAVKAGAPALLGQAAVPTLASDALQAYENIPELGKYLINKLPIPEEVKEKITGAIEQRRPKQEELISNYLPTTSNIKNLVAKVLPDNYFAPRSENEKKMQELASKALNLTSFSNAGILKALGLTASGELGRQLTKSAGGGPIAQNTAEFLFTMMPDVLYGNAKSNLRNSASDTFNKFTEQNAKKTIKAPKIREAIEKIGDKATEYLTFKDNKNLRDFALELQDKFLGNNLKIDKAIEMKQAIDKAYNSLDLTKSGKAAMTNLRTSLADTIIREGKKQKMPLINEYQKANEVWSGLKAGESIVDTFKNAIADKKYQSLTMRNIFGKFPTAAGIAFGGKVAGLSYPKAAALGLVGQELVQSYKFLTKTPGAWEQVQLAARDAIAGNLSAMNARINQLDKKALEFESNEQKKRSARARS